VIGFLFKALWFLFVQLPLMLLVGFIKLIFLPFQLLALLWKGLALLKYALIAAVVFAVAKSVLGALETRGQRITA
jgi:hypothetical protein